MKLSFLVLAFFQTLERHVEQKKKSELEINRVIIIVSGTNDFNKFILDNRRFGGKNEKNMGSGGFNKF